jgi:phosphoribosylanthranilate isomerase
MFRVKICGVTNLKDAQLAVEAGADAIGLNFYAASPRYCPLDRACQIAAGLPPHVCRVGVFVNAPAAEIRRLAEDLSLDLVQLHGDETPEFLRELAPLPMMRALRVADDLAPLEQYLTDCHRLMALPRLLLVDRACGDRYGGTGTTLDWNWLALNRHRFRGTPLVLAGGLNPDNVARAIAAVRPWGVDVASGVEAAPGAKSPELVRRFVEAATTAFRQLLAKT